MEKACGFERVKNKIDIFERGRIRVWLGTRGQFIVYLIDEDTTAGHYIRAVEYLHNFQNLIHALAGTELEVKL